MKLFLVVSLFALLQSFPTCLAAGPLVLPDILRAVTAVPSGQAVPPSAPSQLLSVTSLLSLTSNLDVTNASFGVLPRPQDPSTFDIEGTSFSLRFSEYSQPIPVAQVLVTLIQALLVAIDKIVAARGDVPFRTDIDFNLRHAFFIAYAGEKMTYNLLASIVKGMVGFMLDYGSFGFNVEILDVSDSKIGNCFLSYV